MDPFCGSGTLLIEAALRAKNIAPGLNREFAGEHFDFLKEAFRTEKENARKAIRDEVGFRAVGSDTDPEAIRNAKENAARAGVGDLIDFWVADAVKVRIPDGATVVANPPYGERLMTPEAVEKLYREFSKNYARQKAAGLYVISSFPGFEKVFGKTANKRRKLYNGMIPATLYMYF